MRELKYFITCTVDRSSPVGSVLDLLKSELKKVDKG